MIKSEPSVLYNEHKLSIFIILFYFGIIESKNNYWTHGFRERTTNELVVLI
jgi:hypothetical protein